MMLDDLKQSLAFSDIPEQNQPQQKLQIKQVGITSAKKILENEFTTAKLVSDPSSTFSK